MPLESTSVKTRSKVTSKVVVAVALGAVLGLVVYGFGMLPFFSSEEETVQKDRGSLSSDNDPQISLQEGEVNNSSEDGTEASPMVCFQSCLAECGGSMSASCRAACATRCGYEDVPPPGSLSYCENGACAAQYPDYIIITRPLFVASVQPFVEWKRAQGFRVGILTVDYLHATYQKASPAKSMKAAVMDYSQNHYTKYFLLIGDTIATGPDRQVDHRQMDNLSLPWNVPSGYYCRPELYYPDEDLANCTETTDLYFADFDERNWAENADGIVMRGIYSNSYRYNSAELPFVRLLPSPTTTTRLDLSSQSIDARDLVFSTIVARIPIRRPAEFSPIFEKIRSHRPTGRVDLHLNDEFRQDSASYTAYCAQPYLTLEEAATHIDNCSEHYFAIRDLFSTTARATFNIRDYDLRGGYAAVRDIIQSNEHIIWPIFHGIHSNIELWILGFLRPFPAWISSSCSIGMHSWYNEDSFTERIMKEANGPAFVIHPTNYYTFFRDSLADKTVGEAFYNVGETVVRYSSVSNNLFGDPSLKLFEVR